MDWVYSLGHNCYRLNGEIFESHHNDVLIDSFKKPKLIIDQVSMPINYYSIWYRRWSDNDLVNEIIYLGNKNRLEIDLVRNLSNGVAKDNYSVMKGVVDVFQFKKFLTNLNQTQVFKINVLNAAKRYNLKTPQFILTTRKNNLTIFFEQCNEQIIIKDIDYPFFFNKQDLSYCSYTELITTEEFQNLPEKFQLTFFQQYIEKEYEVRAFYFLEKIYSMVIFSQKDPMTRIDFRRYNYKNPNRIVPYKLPKTIEKKLCTLMHALNLETGSIDILKSISGEYYFLEINPVGQFGMVSDPCNYNIELEIAKYLTI